MRKFTTKRGFTIVEILVAFVIFAIMAAMISTLLMTINKTKRENLDIEEEIEAQRRAYYLSETDMQYDLANKADSLSFSFDGGNDPFTIDYEVGGTNGDGYNLQYPVGSVDYSILTQDALKIEDNDSTNKGGQSVTARYDTRIYGDEDLTDVSVKLEYYGPYNGGHLYMVYSNCTSLKYQDPDTGKSQPYRNYSQYRLVFPSPIMEYGYFNLTDNGDGTKSIETIKKEEKHSNTYKPMINDDGYDIYCPVNKMNLICDKILDEDEKTVINGKTLLYGGIIRVASEQRAIRDDHTSYFEYDGEQFYVVLEDKLDYDHSDPNVPEYKRWDINDITTIFGTNGIDANQSEMEQDDEDRYTYTHYNDKGDVQQNIFGAYPVKDYDPSTPSTPKK